MADFHCDYCGKLGIHTGQSTGTGAKPNGWVQNKSWGFGIKYFCSNKCMNDYNSKNSNSNTDNSSYPESRPKQNGPNMFERMRKEDDDRWEREKERNKEREELKLNNISSIQFGNDPEEISEVLNQLIVIFSSNKSNLNVRKAIVQKMEFGIRKLDQLGSNDVEYFQEKLLKIKPKWWDIIWYYLNKT